MRTVLRLQPGRRGLPLHDLIVQVIDQTRRWVFAGERVPTGEKIVSLFEAHAGIIVKDRQSTMAWLLLG